MPNKNHSPHISSTAYLSFGKSLVPEILQLVVENNRLLQQRSEICRRNQWDYFDKCNQKWESIVLLLFRLFQNLFITSKCFFFFKHSPLLSISI